MKVINAKYASKNGTVSAIRHFEKQFAPNSLKESTIHSWKNLSDWTWSMTDTKWRRFKYQDDSCEENGLSFAAGQPAG